MHKKTSNPQLFFWINTLLTEAEKREVEKFWLSLMTQTGHLDEHKVHGKTHPEERKRCLQSKSANANPLQRTPNRLISSDAQIWNHYSTASFQGRMCHISTEETQRKTTASCGR